MTGARPVLAWLPLDALDVDDRYQREIDTRAGRRVIERIVAEFDWSRFAPLIVTPADAGGRYMILDGQHKAAAARRIEGVDEVPAMIVETDGLAGAAASFVSLNNDRVRVHQYALHRAQLAAGDPDALAIDRVCRAASVIVPAYPVPADRIGPRQTMALRMVGGMIRKHGEDIAAAGLKLVADAYDDRPGGIRANLVKAACAVLDTRPDIGADLLRGRIRARSALDWEHDAETTAAAAGVTRVDALVAAFKGAPIPVSAPVAAPAAPRAAADASRQVHRLSFAVNKKCACGVVFKTNVVGLDKCMRCNR